MKPDLLWPLGKNCYHLILLITMLPLKNAHAFTFDFGSVYSGGSLCCATGHLWNSSLVEVWNYSVDAPQSPFRLVGGTLAGSLQPLDTAEVVFGFVAPPIATLSETYSQTLYVTGKPGSGPIAWVLKAKVFGPGRAPKAVFTLPATGCVNTPITVDGTLSYDPDNVASGSSGISSFVWKLWGPSGSSYRIAERAVTWTPRTEGVYQVELHVTDAQGNMDFTSKSVQIAGSGRDSIPFVGGCLLYTLPVSPIKGPNGHMEVQCVWGAFEVTWHATGSSTVRHIAACKYADGFNWGQYETNQCTGEIERICWANEEVYPHDRAGRCPGRLDRDYYCFDVESGRLQIVKRCEPVSVSGKSVMPITYWCGCESGQTDPRVGEDIIYAGPAPTSDRALRELFWGEEPKAARRAGEESRPPSVSVDVFSSASRGSIAARVRGETIMIPLQGGESGMWVGSTLAAAVNENGTLRNAGIIAYAAQRESDDGVEIRIENAQASELQWQVVGQDDRGLRLVCGSDVPWLHGDRVAGSIVLEWTPTGRRYTLETSSDLPDSSDKWTPLATNSGPVSFPLDGRQRFYRVAFAGRPSAVSRPDGLLAWWAGDGSPAELVSNNAGSASRGITYGAGIVGQAFVLDGVSGYLQLGDAAAVSGTGSFSVALWLSTTQTIASTIVSQRTVSAPGAAWALKLQNGRLHWAIRGSVGVGPDLDGVQVVNDGHSHFVVAVRDIDGTSRIFVDGVLDSSGSGRAWAMVPQEIAVGVDLRDLANSAMPVFLEATLDEIQIYDRALTATEVKGIYDAGEAGIAKLH